MESFPATEQTFLLSSPVGQLEVLATPAPEENSFPGTAIICHPHPLFGGTMTNKVVTTLARAFKDLGLKTVRFNFRGIGKSTGAFDEGYGETDDLLTVVKWVKQVCPDDKLWFAGFSFGGFVATNAATKIKPDGLVTVAPQVSRFSNLITLDCPWIVIQGEADETVSPDEVYMWIEGVDPKPELIRIPSASHFFHGQLLELRTQLVTALSKYINA